MKKFQKLIILIVTFQFFVSVSFSQEEKSRPYLSVGAYMLSTGGSTNGLETDPEHIIGLMSFGFGYEFRLKHCWSLSLGSDVSVGAFDNNYAEKLTYETLAALRVNVSGVSFNIMPRYSFFDGALFIEGVGKLEAISSKAHFWFLEKDSYSSKSTSSGFHFYPGINVGGSINFDTFNTVHLSLGLIEHDFGRAVNKLDLEQSGYFQNENLKKRSSLVLRVIYTFGFKKKRKIPERLNEKNYYTPAFGIF